MPETLHSLCAPANAVQKCQCAQRVRSIVISQLLVSSMSILHVLFFVTVLHALRDGASGSGESNVEYSNILLDQRITTKRSFQLKRTKINYDAAIKQFNVLLPEEMKQPFVDALNSCKDAAKGLNTKDLCEVGFVFTKCMQEKVDNFVFP